MDTKLKHSEKMKIILNVKETILNLMKTVFDGIDSEIRDHTVIINGKTYIKASKVRFTIRSLRHASIKKIQSIGLSITKENIDE